MSHLFLTYYINVHFIRAHRVPCCPAEFSDGVRLPYRNFSFGFGMNMNDQAGGMGTAGKLQGMGKAQVRDAFSSSLFLYEKHFISTRSRAKPLFCFLVFITQQKFA